jgi:hypothetical protein
MLRGTTAAEELGVASPLPLFRVLVRFPTTGPGVLGGFDIFATETPSSAPFTGEAIELVLKLGPLADGRGPEWALECALPGVAPPASLRFALSLSLPTRSAFMYA